MREQTCAKGGSGRHAQTTASGLQSRRFRMGLSQRQLMLVFVQLLYIVNNANGVDFRGAFPKHFFGEGKQHVLPIV